MPIHVPGIRSRRGKVKSVKRNAVAVLQLTAMVDMFTVLCVFLLQNYATTNQILPLADSVELPLAMTVKELAPSNVVVIAKDKVSLNSTIVTDFRVVKEQEDWLVEPLKQGIEQLIKAGEEQKRTLGAQIRGAVTEAKTGEGEEQIDDFRKITIQSDREIDFLTVKKIMYTVTQAGVYEINFAVIKKPEPLAAN